MRQLYLYTPMGVGRLTDVFVHFGNMKIGTVIVTYNRKELLKECINCVLSQTVKIDTVIVVNNNSDDGTREYLDSIKDERVKPFHQKENLGGAGGFYKALQIAESYHFDYVLIIDDDAMIDKNYMKHIVNIGEQSDRFNAFAGAVYTEGKIDTHHRRRILSKLIFAESILPEKEYNKKRVIDFATFCGLVIRGKTLTEIGLPMREYFLWYDDSEFCLRLKDKGKIVLIPKAKLNHKTKPYQGATKLLDTTDWRHYYGYRNRYDCGKKHYGKMTGLVILMQYVVFILISILELFNKEKSEHAKYNISMLKDIITDCIEGKLGVNDKYLPNKK